MTYLVDLNEDALHHLFSFLGRQELCALYSFGHPTLMNAIYFYVNNYGSLVLTEHNCFPGLNTVHSTDDRKRISANWKEGTYGEGLLPIDMGEYPVDLLRMDEDFFYMAMGPKLEIFPRLENGLLDDEGLTTEYAKNHYERPIYALELKGRHLFTSTDFNQLTYYHDRVPKVKLFQLQDLPKPVTELDFNLNMNILAASDRNTISIISLKNDGLKLVKSANRDNRCIKFNTIGNHLYIGQVSDNLCEIPSALIVYDMDKQSVTPLNYRSKGAMTIELCSPHELLIGDFSGDLNLYDLRANENVLIARKGVNRFDSNFCVQYDGQFGVLCGFKGSSEVTLNDLRMGRNPLQTYKVGDGLLGFVADPRHLFCNLETQVKVLDFDIPREEIVRDYEEADQESDDYDEEMPSLTEQTMRRKSLDYYF